MSVRIRPILATGFQGVTLLGCTEVLRRNAGNNGLRMLSWAQGAAEDQLVGITTRGFGLATSVRIELSMILCLPEDWVIWNKPIGPAFELLQQGILRQGRGAEA